MNSGAAKPIAVTSASGSSVYAVKLQYIEITPAIERSAWLSTRLVPSSHRPPDMCAAATITGMPKRLRKKTISPIGKCGPSQRTAANMMANMSIATTLHSMPTYGRSWAASNIFASALIRLPIACLKPAAALKVEPGKHTRDDDGRERLRITPNPLQLRHEAEIHPPD